MQRLDNGWQDHETPGSWKCNAFNLLDMGDGILLEIPPFYDQLAPTLGLPDLEALEIDEWLLNEARLDVLVSMMASDPLWKETEQNQNFKQLYGKKFSLKILEPTEGSETEQQEVNGTWRHFLSESGLSVQCEVDVISKGDGFEVSIVLSYHEISCRIYL
jgi:hypothetical protein